MDLNRLPWMNLSHRPLRTAALLVLTFFLSFVIFAGSMAVVSLQNGLGTLENRLGADIIVVPNTAKRKVDPKTMILDGTPGYFYMEREKMVLISHIEGVEKVSPQIFLASLSASCCSVPVQIIGFEPETDFIFAVIGEEMGFVGACIVIVLLMLIALECISIARTAKDTSGMIIASGMAAVIGFQSFMNIAVTTMIMPNTGIPLPFVSNGMTSLLSLFIGMGFVLNVRLQRKNLY